MVDPDLVGSWIAQGSIIRIGTDDWQYLLSKDAYQISVDGSTLTFPDAKPIAVYNRLYGSARQLIGVWTMTSQENQKEYIEERTYRQDGTYTFHWTENGTFESEYFGKYIDQGTHIDSEERRALINTQSPNHINFDVPYGPDFSGTYFKSDINHWRLTVGGDAIDYVRVT
jgi:hypothetical protein